MRVKTLLLLLLLAAGGLSACGRKDLPDYPPMPSSGPAP